MRIQLSGCAIVNDKEELLLLWKKKHQHFEFPGGKVEPNETLEEAAFRECQEELGVDVTILKYIAHEDFEIDNYAFQSHKYLGIIENNQIPRVNEPDKFEKLFWLPMKRYDTYFCAPNVKGFCQKYIDGKIELSLHCLNDSQ
ncbi:NUDIX hydrolase [Methanococcoides sp. SA1]|nr:NUDIX hydrolase [Methanococcoides sp. SA1]